MNHYWLSILFSSFTYTALSASPVSLHIAANSSEIAGGLWVSVSSVLEDHIRESDQYIFKESNTGFELLVEKNDFDVYREDITLVWPKTSSRTIALIVSDEAQAKLGEMKRQIGKELVFVLEKKAILLHEIRRDNYIGSIDIKTGVGLSEAVNALIEYIDRTGDPINQATVAVDHKTYYIDLRYFFIPLGVIAIVVVALNWKKMFRSSR